MLLADPASDWSIENSYCQDSVKIDELLSSTQHDQQNSKDAYLAHFRFRGLLCIGKVYCVVIDWEPPKQYFLNSGNQVTDILGLCSDQPYQADSDGSGHDMVWLDLSARY